MVTTLLAIYSVLNFIVILLIIRKLNFMENALQASLEAQLKLAKILNHFSQDINKANKFLEGEYEKK
jgi:phosphoglycerol transferase MdoB-like AlkP superfamily enzyme